METYNKHKNEVKLEIKRSYNLIRKLLERIDVNVMDDNNDTPLNVIAKHGHADIVRLLGKQGIDVNQQTMMNNRHYYQQLKVSMQIL